jgi:Holliday junction DNA helicase RuvB
LHELEVDGRGLDSLDRRYLNCIAGNYAGGPVGIDTISAALGEARDALEDVVEPFLIQLGFLDRTPRGRVLTPHAFAHLGLDPPQASQMPQSELFDDGSGGAGS